MALLTIYITVSVVGVLKMLCSIPFIFLSFRLRIRFRFPSVCPLSTVVVVSNWIDLWHLGVMFVVYCQYNVHTYERSYNLALFQQGDNLIVPNCVHIFRLIICYTGAPIHVYKICCFTGRRFVPIKLPILMSFLCYFTTFFLGLRILLLHLLFLLSLC
jgi:hypothetical protein